MEENKASTNNDEKTDSTDVQLNTMPVQTTDEEETLSLEDKLADSNKQNPRTSGLSLASLAFAILIPPLGLIMAMIARAKSKNENKPTEVATAAIIIALTLFLGLLGGGGYYVYKNYNTKTSQSNSTGSTGNAESSTAKNRTADEISAIAQSDKFLNYIKTENYSEAFKMLSPELQKEYAGGEADFAKEVTTANLKLVDSWNITESQANGKEDRVVVTGTANFKGSNPTGKLEFQFYKDSSGNLKMFLWQISPNT